MAIPTDNFHFRIFAGSLKRAIALCGTTDDKDFLARQERQVNALIAKECEFRETLIAHRYGRQIYKNFIRYICSERRNILDARPYFRERQDTFTKKISHALRYRNEEELFSFRFNFRFVEFVMKQKPWWRPWGANSALAKLATEIRAIRNELIVMNMPLAVSRAKIFYSRTPKAHLTYMDFIQIACEGLMSGIDKFVPPFSKAFRSVAIGRITGNFISHYSETTLHFFPIDKRRIYRANKLMGKQAVVVDYDALAVSVNKDIEPAYHTTASEIAGLMAAASTVSSDAVIEHDDKGAPMIVADAFAAPVTTQPDVIVEKAEVMEAMSEAMKTLSLIEIKILRGKGISL